MTIWVTERPDAEQVAEAALGWVLSNMRRILATQPRCSLALAGGSTPRRLYEMMRDLPEGQLAHEDGGRHVVFRGDHFPEKLLGDGFSGEVVAGEEIE